jgi:hypothetical protein
VFNEFSAMANSAAQYSHRYSTFLSVVVEALCCKPEGQGLESL